MRWGKVVLYVVVGFLHVAAAALSFAAEATKIKKSDITLKNIGEICEYPRSPASLLAIVAAPMVCVAQIIISIAAGCGWEKSSSNHPSLEFVLFVFSWVASSMSVTLLVVGAELNNQKSVIQSSENNCYTVNPGLFAGGGCMALVAYVAGVLSHTAFTKSKYSIIKIECQPLTGPGAVSSA